MNKAYQRLVESGDLTNRQLDVYQVMFVYRKKYPNGMTTREINEWLDHDLRRHSGVHSRLRELAEIGLVKKIGQRYCHRARRNVNVWTITYKDEQGEK